MVYLDLIILYGKKFMALCMCVCERAGEREGETCSLPAN